MFRLYFTLFIFFLGTSISTLASSEGGEGGESGGGGGVAPAEFASPAQIREAIYESRLALTLYFNNQSILDLNNPSAEGDLWFRGKRDIFSVIKTASIELQQSGPCLDRSGNKKDGAAPGSHANSICVSVKTLSAKLTPENFRAQTIALVGHELSHLLGATEAQAVALQKNILAVYQPKSASFSADLRMRAETAFHGFPLHLGYARYWSKDPQRLNDILNELRKYLTQDLNRQLFSAKGISVLDAKQSDLWWAYFWKIRMLSEYACANNEKSIHKSGCQKYLEQAFENDDAVSLPIIEARFRSRKNGKNPVGFQIQRITSAAILETEFASAEGLLMELRQSVASLPQPRSSSEPKFPLSLEPTLHPVEWSTDQVQFSAENFLIQAGKTDFVGSFQGVEMHSDPGHSNYWTMELTWIENAREMRLYIYFQADATHWWADEIRTYDGEKSGDWIYYRGDFFRRPLGQTFEGDFLAFGASEENVPGMISIKNLKILPIFHQ